MNLKGSWATVAGALALTAGAAHATSIPVQNYSFEQQPVGGLTNSCGTGCSYSLGVSIPGWVTSGFTNDWIPGVQDGNTAFFDYIPDGITIAGSEGVADGLSQTVGVTAVAGETYTLSLSVGRRRDCCLFGPLANLVVGSTTTTATGVEPSPGDWTVWTASYTATAADAGQPITIELGDTGIYTGYGATTTDARYDDVTLTSIAASGAPEPATWGLMILGVGLAGVRVRGRGRGRAAWKSAEVFATGTDEGPHSQDGRSIR